MLPVAQIHEILDAAIATGLTRSQDALLAGLAPAFVATLPRGDTSVAQLLVTLNTLNTARLTDGSSPLRAWLANAMALSGGRVEQRVFERALAAEQAGGAGGQEAPGRAAPAPAGGATAPAVQRQKLFVSYSHADTAWLDRLRVHLRPLDRAGKIDFWDDSRIPVGSNWRQEIKRALDAASIAVLLVSADFLASDFIAGEELPKLLQAEAHRGLQILPVIVSPCLFTMTPILSDYQAANDPKRPLSALSKHEQDEVFLRVAQRIGAG